ncbi:8-amino-7-oxononanoate synthase [Desulfallas sp. Bu1-1]|uniref:8-amino-7-oxononanoate synthase n=1 Tax=Desulfallas sp. Bu1-1 TaxID=2787620 RepID=UPI00189D20B7|nr:8-amino-7-oxononanoate synthase [Desulfallas sp. Bu1-1]MBF7082988.1 8-amino-7-oxononanoate synthase [Desulfallas sp. Bu1-1]
MNFLLDELATLKSGNLYRTLKQIDGSQAARTIVDGRDCILLSSNNYLGLTEHPEIKAAMKEAIERWGAGSGGSRLINGNLGPHVELEREIARFKGTEAAIVFNTGYMANVGVITALTGKEDVIISDELNHASIIDGCRLSRAEVKIYRHKDMNHLQEILQQTRKYRRRLIITDGVFSMDGDIAPLPEISALADKYEAIVMVDDAHATGVLGNRGTGTAEYFGLEGKIPIQMGTLSKALGSCGAYVAGQFELIDFLRNKARSFIFSTALPPAVIAASIAAIKVVRNHPEIRKKLWENACYLRAGLEKQGYRILAGESPIIPVFIGDETKTMQLTNCILEKGVYVSGIRPPTVPPGTSRIRVTVMAIHSREDLDEALDAFKQAGKETGVI